MSNLQAEIEAAKARKAAADKKHRAHIARLRKRAAAHEQRIDLAITAYLKEHQADYYAKARAAVEHSEAGGHDDAGE